MPVIELGDEVAVNKETAAPPFAPAVKETDDEALAPPLAVPIVGACGTVVAVIEDEADEALDVPTAFVAVTVNV